MIISVKATGQLEGNEKRRRGLSIEAILGI